ncbi:MAG: MOSC domain-containing protein [Nitrospinae bacterium]|nr:MOSC domain-containing protein [Nitrospinota bacterium]
MLKLVSINIALPQAVSFNEGGKKYRTGIFKKPVNEEIFLDQNGLLGDGVGDKRFHGGKDLAVCAYFVDHYAFWESELNRELSPGAFGENLSLTGLDETKINIGDQFSLGEAEIEVSQPRQPCHKLNKVFHLQAMACKVQTMGYTGCYFRVKKMGLVNPNSKVKKIKDGQENISIDDINSLMFKEKKNIDLLRKVVNLEALSLEWREKFQKRLEVL